MESPVVIKTEVEEGGGESATKWVNTKGHCFLCLERSASMKVIGLQGLLRHLQINQGDVSMVGESAEFPAQEWDKITVDLCMSCGTRASKLNCLLRDLEKIQMEIKGLLEQTHKSISESSKDPKLVVTFMEKMTNEVGTLLNLGIVTKIRKEFMNKVSALVQAPSAPTEIPSATAQRDEMEVDEPEASTSASPVQGNSDNRTGLPNTLRVAKTKATEKGSGILTRLQNSRQGGKTGKEGSKEKTSRFAGGGMSAPEAESSPEPDSPPNEVENPTLPVANAPLAPSPCCSTSIPTELPERRKSLQRKKPSEVGSSTEGTSDEVEAELESETSETEEAPEEIPEITKPREFYCTKKAGWFCCKKCGKKSKEFHDLLKHYKALHLRMKLKCGICNKKEFSYQSNLSRHKKICRRNLERRQAQENDPRFVFVCEVCGKRFACGHRLDTHRKTHDNVNRYHCDICDKKFSSQGYLNMHKNVVHCGKLLPCKFCRKQFTSQVMRWRHQNSCPKRQPPNDK